MNKYALIFCFLFWGYFAMAQTNDIMEFQSIRLHDTIKTKQTFKTINEVDKINDTFFFTTKYLKEEGLFLIEKEKVIGLFMIIMILLLIMLLVNIIN